MSTQNIPPAQDTPPAAVDEDAQGTADDEELVATAPATLATGVGDYFGAIRLRIKNGEAGSLPVIIGVVVIAIFFQIERSEFLTAGNLVNLLVQASIFVVFGVAETFALLLSEIDLSLGYGAGVGAFVMAELIASPVNLPWWLGIIGGLVTMAILGTAQGLLIARLRLPSFVVTLGGQLAFLGLMQEIANADKTAVGGTIQLDSNTPVYKLVSSSMSTSLAWILLVVCIVWIVFNTVRKNRSRRSHGLTAPPIAVALVPVILAAIVGVVLVLICNANRGTLTVLRGMPWVIPFVLLIVAVYSWFMAHSRTGRYIYAVGNNPEAARRAGINVKWIVTFGFIMANVTAGFAGLIYMSNQGSMSIDINGGQYVLFAVAAAVIGGASLFGGRGKISNSLLGGLVIAVVYNGLGLMGVSAPIQDMVTAAVLIVAVSLDAIVRARRTAH